MQIKNIIIIVLTLLLVMVVLAYSYLASQMQDYEKKRLEYIINKEYELNQKENEINKGKVCQVKLSECEITKKHIKSILDELTTKKNNTSNINVKEEQEQKQELNNEQKQEQEQYEDSVEPNL